MAITRLAHSRRLVRMLWRLALLLVVVVAAAGILALIVWAIPTWLTRESVLAEVDRYKAMADIRTGLAAALAAVGAAGGLAYTARTFRLGQVAQLTGRFESASKQIGDDDQTVRLAGIHAMAQLADQWEEQRQACVDVLCAFLRVTSDPTGTQPEDLREAHRTTIRLIKARLHRKRGQVNWQQCEFDLTGAVLKDADFSGAIFAGARFLFDDVKFDGEVRFNHAVFARGRVSFRGAKLPVTNLTTRRSVSFVRAKFQGGEVVFDEMVIASGEARFDTADFGSSCRVTFKRAEVRGMGSIYFEGATARGSGLSLADAEFHEGGGEVNFNGARFSGTVHFDGALFDREVHFDGAYLVGASLVFAGARLSGGRIIFDGAHCTGTKVDLEDAQIGATTMDFRRAAGKPDTNDVKRLVDMKKLVQNPILLKS
jgi:uncharacterized protein YjbI with pentapeptide repeats